MLKLSSFFVVIIGFLVLVGCSKDTFKEVRRFDTRQNNESGIYPTLDGVYTKLNQLKQNYDKAIRLYEIDRSAKLNQPIPLLRIAGSSQESGSKKFLIVAGTHGDEAAAVAALCYTMERIMAEGLGDTLLQRKISADFVPVHNPDGYSENERENGSGKDLNRNFPVGYLEGETEPETRAIMHLVNQTKYRGSLFLHSANERKYENLIRVPVEFQRLGEKALRSNFIGELHRLRDIITAAGNKGNPETNWHSASNMVNAPGIASDWCVSGFINESHDKMVKSVCKTSHPSLTIEICYPKQPSDEARLLSEKEETFRIVRKMLLDF